MKKRIIFFADDQMMTDLKQLKKKSTMSMSEIIRQATKTYIANANAALAAPVEAVNRTVETDTPCTPLTKEEKPDEKAGNNP